MCLLAVLGSQGIVVKFTAAIFFRNRFSQATGYGRPLDSQAMSNNAYELYIWAMAMASCNHLYHVHPATAILRVLNNIDHALCRFH